jgi:outer membrane lipoprotein-sorting protein
MKSSAVLLLFTFSAAWSVDAFLSSCFAKLAGQVQTVKSLKAEMVQTMDILGHTAEQKATILYLLADKAYSRMETETPMGKMTMLCRGDTTYIKMGSAPWSVKTGACTENPLFGGTEKLKSLPLQFQKDSSGFRLYKSTEDGSRYAIESKTCRLTQIETSANGQQATSRVQYQAQDGMDVPVRTETDLAGQGRSVVEFKSVKLNLGLTKAFFRVE